MYHKSSILGLLLFTLYINDIVEAAGTYIELVMFEDDATFFISAAALLLLHEKIAKLFRDLSRYLPANKLIQNLRKSKLMFFLHQVPQWNTKRYNV